MSIESPCTLICSIDHKTGYCFGCGRTGAEITRWVKYKPEQRRHIMAQLPGRLDKIEKKPRRITKRKRLKSTR